MIHQNKVGYPSFEKLPRVSSWGGTQLRKSPFRIFEEVALRDLLLKKLVKWKMVLVTQGPVRPLNPAKFRG